MHRRCNPGLSIAHVALVLVGVFGCAVITYASPKNRPEGVEQVINDFLVPFSSRDVAGFMAYFAEDATVFFPPSASGAPPGRVQGRANVARAFDELFKRVGVTPGPRPTIRPLDPLVQQFGDTAIVTFHLGTDASRGRRTLVLRRIGGDWRIVHLHASDFRAQ
jgi:ketosteroid isomerase-like protein